LTGVETLFVGGAPAGEVQADAITEKKIDPMTRPVAKEVVM
jgi:hypothetical protein